MYANRGQKSSDAVEWAFPDRGREADVLRAKRGVENAVTAVIRK